MYVLAVTKDHDGARTLGHWHRGKQDMGIGICICMGSNGLGKALAWNTARHRRRLGTIFHFVRSSYWIAGKHGI